ncbi:MAG: MFS transporter [Ardenticatenaceae bacterium]
MAILESITTDQAATVVPRAARVDTLTRLVYGVGEIVNSVKSIIFGLFTLFFYTTVIGLPGTLVGVASAIGLVWDAVIDPYIGHLSDRLNGRLGRYPFMLVGALTVGVSFWAFFSPPSGMSTMGLFVWLLTTSLLVRTASSVYGVPYYALGAELSQDYHERTSITATRGFLALLGTLGAAALSFLVFFPNAQDGVDPKLNTAGYPAMGFWFGLLMTAIGLIATLGTMARRPQVAEPGPMTVRDRQPFWSDFLLCLRQPAFLLVFVSFSLFFLGIVINYGLSIHYMTYYAGITNSFALSLFQALFFLGGMAGVVAWTRVSRRIEKHWLYLVGTLWTAILLACAYLLVGEGRWAGTGNAGALMVGHALGGFFGSVLWFVPGSMIADIADQDELLTGRRREGSFFGIFLLGQQLATGISLLVTGILLEWFAGLVPGQATQSAQTVSRIGMMYGILPAILIGVAALLLWRYPLSHARVSHIRTELARRQRDWQVH